MVSPQLVNPYIAGSPITGSEMFFGREDVFSFVRQNLIGRHRDTPIVLYGQRRTGKTSVLYQLHRHLDSKYLCIFIDVHGLSLDGIGKFLFGTANSISRSLQRDFGLNVKVPDRDLFLTDPLATFESTFLEALWPVLGEKHLILMMDEFIRLQEEVAAGRLQPEIFEYLRHLMQHCPQLSFIFSLGSGLEEMEAKYAFLFSASLYRRISFLKTEAATELITSPVQDCYQVMPDTVAKILQITSGHAYYTQLVCHCLFDRWVRSPKPTMTVEDVDAVVSEAIELGTANLKYVWEDATPQEQALMVAMAAAMRTTNSPVTVKQIDEAWHDVNVSLPEGEIAQAVRNLISREVITGDRTFSFAVDLQRLWLDKHRRLDWVKEELTPPLREFVQEPRLPRPRRRRTAITSTVAVLVLLGAGLAWQLAKSSNHLAQTPTHPTLKRTGSTFIATSSAITPKPKASNGKLVTIGPNAAHQADASQIAVFLERYFAAINNRDYATYVSLFTAQAEPDQNEQQFLAGYSSTTDSNATIVTISPARAGRQTVAVTFDSHQDSSISVTHTACVTWHVTLQLEQQGTTYLITGYSGSYHACP